MPGPIFYQPPQPTQATPHAPIPAQGDAPPPGVPPALAQLLRLSWEPPALAAQNVPGTAAWNVPPAVVTFVAFTRDALAPRAWQPPDPPPAQHAPAAPIPTRGDYPPPGPVPAAVTQSVVCASWPPPWYPAQAAPHAPVPAQGQQPPLVPPLAPAALAWVPPDPPPAQKILYAPIPAQGQQAPVSWPVRDVLARSWLPPDPLPAQKVLYAPIPAQGDQPPRLPLPNVILPLWVPPWTAAQSDPPTAAWNFPPPVVNAPPPTSWVNQTVTLRTWVPPDPQPQRLPPFTPIPAQGDQPPRSPLPTVIRAAWEPPWTAAQSAPPGAAELFVPAVTFVAFAPPPAAVLRSWQPPDPPAQRGVLSVLPGWSADRPPPSSRVLQAVLVRAWEPPPPMPAQKPVAITPLTFVYGQQPPRFSRATQGLILRSWEPPPPMPPRQYPIQIVSVGVTPGVIHQYVVEVSRGGGYVVEVGRGLSRGVEIDRGDSFLAEFP